MKFISLFSGIGGFEKGFEEEGMECVTQVENDPYARATLSHHWPNITKYGDIRNVTKRNLGAARLICGGFPCQDISVAGHRSGLDGERSGLWFEFGRIIRDHAPQWVVIENVPGLYSSNDGEDFKTIIRSLDEWGYGVAWRRLDSQYYRLAQRRKRVYIVGSLGNISAGKVLFEPESLSWNTAPSRRTREVRPPHAENSPASIGLFHDKSSAGEIRVYGEISPTMTKYWGTGGNNVPYVPELARSLDTKEGRRMSTDTGTLIPEPGIYQWASGGGDDIKDTAQTLRSNPEVNYQVVAEPTAVDVRNMAEANVSSTLQTKGNSLNHVNPIIDIQWQIRRLMPIECERLQGFPDNWTAMHSDSQRYRLLGNAVSVPVAQWIAQRILKYDT